MAVMQVVLELVVCLDREGKSAGGVLGHRWMYASNMGSLAQTLSRLRFATPLQIGLYLQLAH